MACAKEQSFHDHQRKYLQPAIVSVWNDNQSVILSECVSKGPLTVGGDGRADSPGHSAKYGSYGIMDLTSNKVIHIELVQVSGNYSVYSYYRAYYLKSNDMKSSTHTEHRSLVNTLQFLGRQLC